MSKQVDPARDASLAADVARHIKNGLTLCASCRAVADEFALTGAKRLSAYQIEQIYRRNRPRTVS